MGVRRPPPVMSGELTPAEVRQRLEDIRRHVELGAEIAVRMSGELAEHIEHLSELLADREQELADEKAAHETCCEGLCGR